MTKREEKKETTKQLLVDTALALFSEKGYEATSIRNIASEAGLSLGLLYNYFKSKEELLLEIFRQGNEDIIESFVKDKTEKGASSLKQHILQTVQLLKEKRRFWRLLHSLRFQQNVMTSMVQEIQGQIAFIQAKIKNNLEEAGIPAPEAEAKLLFATIDGMAAHYLLDESYPIDEVANLLIKKYTSH